MINNQISKFDISSFTLLRVVVFGLALWFLWFIRDILVVLLVGVLIASALEPLTTKLQKFHIPRAISALTTFILFLGILTAAVTSLLPPLISEIQNLAENLPALYEKLSGILGRAGELFGFADLLPAFQKNISNIGQLLASASGGVFATTRSVFDGVFSLIVIFVIAFYLIISRDSLYAFVRSVVPTEHQPYAVDLIKRVQGKIGRWLLGQVILGAIMGTLVFLGLWAINVPYALAIGLLTFFAEFVPVIGPVAVSIPAVALGLTNSWLTGVLVIVVFVVANQIESHVLIPNVMKRTIGLNPLTTILAVLIGAKLAGFVGILLAVPLATIISVFVADLLPGGREEEIAG